MTKFNINIKSQRLITDSEPYELVDEGFTNTKLPGFLITEVRKFLANNELENINIKMYKILYINSEGNISVVENIFSDITDEDLSFIKLKFNKNSIHDVIMDWDLFMENYWF